MECRTFPLQVTGYNFHLGFSKDQYIKVCIWHCVLVELWDTAFNKIIGLFSDIGLAFNSIIKWGTVIKQSFLF